MDSEITIEEKAKMLDWLLSPESSGRADRPDRIARIINRSPLQALLEFRAWGTRDEIISALRKSLTKDSL